MRRITNPPTAPSYEERRALTFASIKPVKSTREEIASYFAEVNREQGMLSRQNAWNSEELARAREETVSQSNENEWFAIKRAKYLVTKAFMEIFCGQFNSLPQAKVNEVFSRYLSNQEFVIECKNESLVKEGELKINSSDPIMRYLNDHEATSTCDFSLFAGSMAKIVPLVADLAQANSSVKSVTIDKNVADDVKAGLAAAVAGKTLTILYV